MVRVVRVIVGQLHLAIHTVAMIDVFVLASIMVILGCLTCEFYAYDGNQMCETEFVALKPTINMSRCKNWSRAQHSVAWMCSISVTRMTSHPCHASVKWMPMNCQPFNGITLVKNIRKKWRQPFGVFAIYLKIRIFLPPVAAVVIYGFGLGKRIPGNCQSMYQILMFFSLVILVRKNVLHHHRKHLKSFTSYQLATNRWIVSTGAQIVQD